MSTTTIIDGVRIQTADPGMCLTNGDVWVKEIALGKEAEEWIEVPETEMPIIDVPFEEVKP